MRKAKKNIIAVSFFTILAVVFLTPAVMATNYFYHYSTLFNTRTHYGSFETMVTYSDSCYLNSSKSGYEYNLKYVSDSSFQYNANSKNSGFVNGAASTIGDPLNVTYTSNVDKVSFYGVIYNGSTSSSGMLDRIWVYKYRNATIASKDGITNFDP